MKVATGEVRFTVGAISGPENILPRTTFESRARGSARAETRVSLAKRTKNRAREYSRDALSYEFAVYEDRQRGVMCAIDTIAFVSAQHAIFKLHKVFYDAKRAPTDLPPDPRPSPIYLPRRYAIYRPSKRAQFLHRHRAS